MLFCWLLARQEGLRSATDCEQCDYRQRWVRGELNTRDFVKRFDRRKLPRHTRKILVVDDEPNILYALEEAVRGKGYECISACDGEEGLIMARGIRPDLIITDVIMPKIDGYEFCERLKQDPETSKIPVIIVTVRASEKDIRHGSQSGADAYLTKPFQVHELEGKIDLLLAPKP